MRKKYNEALLAQMVQHDAALNAQIEANRKDRELARERIDLDKQIHKDNLRTRDRVDISLSEYEKLKSDLKLATATIHQYENIFRALHIDLSIVDDIVVDSIKVKTGFDIRRNENMAQIEFNYLWRPEH